ncbi:MAG TPA: plastocyanin/azurin family copper-binding protein, partial [Candidatus Limnocylindrales bacterium]
VIRMDVCSFAPTVSRVAVGTTVRFLNTSTIEHAVVGRSTTWGSEILSPGNEYAERFDAAGTYPFSCPLHPGMVGAIVVGGDAGAQPADLAVATDPTPSAEPGADPMSIALVGLGGLAAGLALGSAITLLRRRTTA